MASIVYLLPSLGWGGAERLACTMHRLACARGWTSRIDAPDLAALTRGIAEDTGERPSARARAAGSEGDLGTWARAASRRVAEGHPDVVHAHLPYPDRLGAVAIAARGRPLVVTFGLLPEQERTWTLDLVLHTRSDRVLAVASRVVPRARFVAVSAADAQNLARRVPARRLVYIANGPPLPPVAPPVLAPPPWPEDRAVVRLLSIGRLHRQKGFDRLIAALADPEVRDARWHWLLAGDGDEREALARAVADADLAARVSWVRDYPAAQLYPTADLVLSPSRWEGLPLVPMEAAEAGVPVVASAIAPHRELFGSASARLLPEDPTRWPAALARWITTPAARAELARAQREALPSDPRQNMWEAYEALYRALIPR
jgi:glycosyltransferase involved in cell wall biosynthesis